jgi:hypothetical protein
MESTTLERPEVVSADDPRWDERWELAPAELQESCSCLRNVSTKMDPRTKGPGYRPTMAHFPHFAEVYLSVNGFYAGERVTDAHRLPASQSRTLEQFTRLFTVAWLLREMRATVTLATLCSAVCRELNRSYSDRTIRRDAALLAEFGLVSITGNERFATLATYRWIGGDA